jgi:DNA repair protein RecN (Recombination protein N)
VADSLSSVRRLFQDLERFDPVKGAEFATTCENALSILRELSGELSSYADSVDMDEREFAALEERLRVLQTLKRRYGPSLEDVAARLEKDKARVDVFENSERVRTEMAAREADAANAHKAVCVKLAKARREAALTLSKEVVKELERLDFLKSSFSVEFSETEPGPNGSDRVEFLFSANPGQPERPLKSVASSGEMSRVMLAIKVVLAEADSTPLLIFDEVDVNIGGRTALKVGDGLAKLGRDHQVLCISHLPQVAAKGDSHFLVEKRLRDGAAETFVAPIKGKRRIEEISRMLGGGKASVAHAKELLGP